MLQSIEKCVSCPHLVKICSKVDALATMQHSVAGRVARRYPGTFMTWTSGCDTVGFAEGAELAKLQRSAALWVPT